MVGEGHRTGIHTEVERISRLVFAYKVSKIRAKETSAVQIFLFSRLPKLARRSTTLDKGVGFIAAASVGDHHPRIVCWHHLLDFLVAVPGPDLVDRDLISVEGHQVGVLSTYPPASIISVYRWRFPYRAA
jgi:hypothetical protein